MTPISTTKDRLILRRRPVLLALGVGAAILLFAAIAVSKVSAGDTEGSNGPLILLLLFLAVFAVFVRQEEATFDRPAGEVVLRTLSLFGRRTVRYPLEGLRKAVAERDKNDTTDGSGKGKPLTRPVLDYGPGKVVPLSNHYQSGSDAQVTVKAINAWLRVKG